MVFVTGDKHGDYQEVEVFTERFRTTKDDVMVVLGDNGINFYDGLRRDRRKKEQLEKMPLTFVLIKGNHDMRPSHVPGIKLVHINRPNLEGWFWQEPQFPSLLYTKEYGLYRLGNETAYVIGGAYSVDKDYRLEMQWAGYKDYKWFADEQLSAEEMQEAERELSLLRPECVLSHTCPLSHKPFDKIAGADETMEQWMSRIEKVVKPDRWFCGHWHIDKIDSPGFRFMYHDIVEL